MGWCFRTSIPLPFGGEDFKTNLIMPELCPFLRRNLWPHEVWESGPLLVVQVLH
jgi:hypothetical protein